MDYKEIAKMAIYGMPDIDDTQYQHSIQLIYACLLGERDALIKLKQANDKLDGDAAALRGNLLNLIIDNLTEQVLKPLEEARYR